jgi:menaquinone-9 beta-reductase
MKQIRYLKTDVLIVGAGPSGSAAAYILAKNGFQVILVDKLQFPRDKVCGDGILNDTLNAMSVLNIKHLVLQEAFLTSKLRIYAPDGNYVNINGEFVTLPRIRFDEILLTNATSQGAQFMQLSLEDSVEDNGGVAGALFSEQNNNSLIKIYATITLLATGASVMPLKKFKVCINSYSSAFAIRGYFENNNLEHPVDYLSLCYFKKILPGYGWVFPLKKNLFNIGVGYHIGPKKDNHIDIFKLWNLFVESSPEAKAIVNDNHDLSKLKGAFLRMGLQGTQFYRKGLLVIGEAAGLTYPFSGEGIGKSMESAIIASAEIIKHLNAKSESLLTVGMTYEKEILTKFRKRYKLYKRAQDWLSFPSVANFICWRANRSRFLMGKLVDLINEKCDPGSIFSIKSFIKSLFY